jgi:hypothetical protein
MRTVNHSEIKFFRQRLEQISGGVLNERFNRLSEVVALNAARIAGKSEAEVHDLVMKLEADRKKAD